MGTIGIVGGSGFVGSHVASLLVSEGEQVVIFTRDKHKVADKKGISYAYFDYVKKECDTQALSRLDAIVNLAGAGIADKRWTAARKKEIVASRVDNTHFLIAQLKAHAPQCSVFVAASAIGIYGEDKPSLPPFTETAPADAAYLGDTCKKWESASAEGTAFMRTVILRLGIVLGKESGAFREFEKPMQLGVMPILGGGSQVISWIEVSDLARLIVFSLKNNAVSGIYNAVAPYPVSNKELMHTIGEVKGGFKIPVPVPAFVLKLMLGEMSIEILKSCTVSAQKTLSTGFSFQYPAIAGAVKHILNR